MKMKMMIFMGKTRCQTMTLAWHQRLKLTDTPIMDGQVLLKETNKKVISKIFDMIVTTYHEKPLIFSVVSSLLMQRPDQEVGTLSKPQRRFFEILALNF